MAVCASCGAENRDEARFCDSCGAALAEAAPAREVRKVVTVLFCDVTGSTALGERIDPESLRRVMARYFETAKAIVERHGGTVEKFIGDAVMAVFGVPAVHEDDALRAVRAADGLRGGLGELNDELEGSYGTRLELRIGVNTGEVVTGTEERLATGDAVNVAARLEQAAEPGEILLGEETYRLVRNAVECEPAEPIRAKGKYEPLQAYRLRSVSAEAPARPHGAPMVGRERQGKLLEDAFAAVAAERACHLFTILGTAGVGKSRLADEFLGTLSGVTSVRGRCLSYGEGISYWPVTEVLKQIGAAETENEALASILGDDSAASTPDEIAWAFRKLLESRAAERPVVVVFDDVHWGEPAFLDLVEHVADLSRGAPIFLLCMARPELLDRRPTWGGGKLNATNVLLEPLAPEEAGDLIEALTDGIAEDLRERILEAAGGNPLFVEEMVAMAAAEGGEVSVPPTIQALLAARLDQLEPGERGVLECAAIEGLVFHRGAVAALAPEEQQVEGRLVTLVRKDLVRPEQPVLPGDDAYRFRHLLIRDTAYDALPKAVRAELHERFALWLEEHGAALVELDEIVGYHLEQAYRYRSELGPNDDAADSIAHQAARRLLAAGERAQERADFPAARNLIGRAVELMPADNHERLLAQVDLAMVATNGGSYAEARSFLTAAERSAQAAGDEVAQVRAELAELELGIHTDSSLALTAALSRGRDCAARLEQLGDEEGLVWADGLVGKFYWWTGRTGEAQRWFARARERAARVKPRLLAEVDTWWAFGLWSGPEPVDSAIEQCDQLLAEGVGGAEREATVRMIRATLRVMQGDASEGLAEAQEGHGVLEDIGHRVVAAGTTMMIGEGALLAGNPAAAEEALSEGYDMLKELSHSGYLTSVAATRAQAALELGREDRAVELADEALGLVAEDDFEPIARSRAVRAVVFARRGDYEGAAREIADAVQRVEKTDFLTLKAMIALAEAEVAALAGRPDEERDALRRALELSEQKGDRLTAARARERMGDD